MAQDANKPNNPRVNLDTQEKEKRKNNLPTSLAEAFFGTKVKVADDKPTEEIARKYADQLYEHLDKTAVQLGGISNILDFTVQIFKKYYNLDLYLDERTSVKTVFHYLVTFDSKITYAEYLEKEKIVEAVEKLESRSLNAQDVSLLMDELVKYEGREEEAEHYLQRFIPEDKRSQLAKLIPIWKKEFAETKKVMRASKTERVEPIVVGDQNLADIYKAGEESKIDVDNTLSVLMAAETVKMAHQIAIMSDGTVTVEQAREVLIKIGTRTNNRPPSRREIESIVSEYNHGHDTKIAILGARSSKAEEIAGTESVLKMIENAGGKLIAARVTYSVADDVVKQLIDPNILTNRVKFTGQVATQIALPSEHIISKGIIISSIREEHRGDGNQEAQLEKGIKSAAANFYGNDPTLAFISASSFATQQIERQTALVSNGAQMNNIADPRERAMARRALENVAKTSIAVSNQEASILVRQTAYDKAFDQLRRDMGDTKVDIAVDNLAALTGMAYMGKNALGMAAEFDNSARILERNGIRIEGIGSLVSSTKNAVGIITDAKMLPFFKQFQDRALSSKFAGSILNSLKNGKVGNIIEFTSKVLNVDELIYKGIVGHLTKTGLARGAQAALSGLAGKLGLAKLSVGVLGRFAGIRAAALALSTAIPIPGLNWAIGFLAGSLLEKTLGNLSKKIKEDGLLAGVLQAPLILAGGVINVMYDLAKAVMAAGLSAAIGVIMASMFIAYFIINLFVYPTFIGTLVPPIPQNGFQANPNQNIASFFPNGIVSPECPSGKPVQGFIYQGPFTGRIGHGNAIDIPVRVGTEVKVTHSGTVVFASQTFDGYGYLVKVAGSCEHPVTKDKVSFTTYYAHNSMFVVKVGQVVQRGDTISYSGGQPGAPGAGNTTGPHVHYELRDFAKIGNILNFL